MDDNNLYEWEVMIIGYVQPAKSPAFSVLMSMIAVLRTLSSMCLQGYLWSTSKQILTLCSEGGFFKARLSFPEDFPLNPPKMRFITPMWHPNSTLSNLQLPRICVLTPAVQFTPMVSFASRSL